MNQTTMRLAEWLKLHLSALLWSGWSIWVGVQAWLARDQDYAWILFVGLIPAISTFWLFEYRWARRRAAMLRPWLAACVVAALTLVGLFANDEPVLAGRLLLVAGFLGFGSWRCQTVIEEEHARRDKKRRAIDKKGEERLMLEVARAIGSAERRHRTELRHASRRPGLVAGGRARARAEYQRSR